MATRRLSRPGGSARHIRCVPVTIADWNGGVPSDCVGGAAQSVCRDVCSRPLQSDFEGPCLRAHGGRRVRSPAVRGMQDVAVGVPDRVCRPQGRGAAPRSACPDESGRILTAFSALTMTAGGCSGGAFLPCTLRYVLHLLPWEHARAGSLTLLR